MDFGLYTVKAYAISQRTRNWHPYRVPCETAKECRPMPGETRNPIRSHFEVMKRLAQYLYLIEVHSHEDSQLGQEQRRF